MTVGYDFGGLSKALQSCLEQTYSGGFDTRDSGLQMPACTSTDALLHNNPKLVHLEQVRCIAALPAAPFVILQLFMN